jgi:hypothetical protein
MSNSPAGVDFRPIDDLDVNSRTVLARADMNVPAQGGNVTSTTEHPRDGWRPTAFRALPRSGSRDQPAPLAGHLP